MTSIQIACFLGVMFIAVLKAISMKPCADRLPPTHAPLFLSFWMSITLAGMLPFFYHDIAKDFYWGNYALLYGVLKGIFFFFYVNAGQQLSKETASSRAFLGAMAAGVIALVNVSLFGADLNIYQITSAILMTALGFIYYFKGHLSTTSAESHRSFMTLLFLAVVLSVLDHAALSQLFWLSYLVVNIPIMLVISYFMVKDKNEITPKFFVSNKYLGVAAVIYVFAELFLTKIRVSVISVTVSNIAVLMAIPLIMVIMSIFWGESTIKKQAGFGIMVFLIGMIAFIN